MHKLYANTLFYKKDLIVYRFGDVGEGVPGTDPSGILKNNYISQ